MGFQGADSARGNSGASARVLDILQPSGPSQTALLINKASMNPAKTLWHTPGSCASTPKRVKKCYFVPSKGGEFLFLHLLPNSLVVQVATERSRQQYPKAIPCDKGHKQLNLLGRKVFSSTSPSVQGLELSGPSCHM